jgi:hypothetical protein
MCGNIGVYVNNVVDFFNHPFFIIVGGISTVLIIISFCYTVILVLKGVLPVWYRIGMGLSKRKIAIFAETEFGSLKSMLVDSRIFKDRNIIQIHKNDLNKAAGKSMFLVHWKDYRDKINDILSIKKDSTALIVYAPQNEGRIEPPDIMEKINSHRNTIVVSFRGRLLNDIMVSLITTGYEQI